jgi:glutamate synthase (NADPH/NADH) small chain
MQSIPGEELAIDRKARARVPAQERNLRPVEDRLRDFNATFQPLTEDEAREAASRCIHCPDPAPCAEACPVHNDIPSAMWLIEQGDFIGAAEIYRRTSSMPEICGLVCPHEALCEGSCVRSKREESVQSGALEAFTTTYQRQHAGVEIEVAEPTGKKVALIGAGPSSLGCAEVLMQRGHAVTFFEALPEPGGLLIYGIPNFKLTKDIVQARVQDYIHAGAEFKLGTRVGQAMTVDDLLSTGYDAVFVGIGTGLDATMEAPGVELPGVWKATEFLMRANVTPELLPPDKRQAVDIGQKVVVIGGGDTASDCLRTAVRLGAEQVTCLYRRTEAEMPGGKKDRELAKEEGAKYRFLTQPVRFIAGPDGRLSGVECLQCELGEPDASGRRRPIPIEGSNFVVSADTAIMALGYWPDPIVGKSTPDMKTDKWGQIQADLKTGATSKPAVFAGGDAVTGPDLVVTAMAAGRRAGEAIHQYLQSG